MIKIQLLWYAFVLVLTEGLSLFGILNRGNVIVAYVLFILALSFLYGKKILTGLKKPFKITFFGAFLFLLFALTFFQGLFSAPSTTDSMVYHIPRVMYWIQDQSVFQRIIETSHDFMPPFSEYVLVNIYLLSNGDRFLFMSQWISFVSSVFLGGLIARRLGADWKKSKVLMLLTACLPIILMQSVSTQTDLIVLNLILISLYIVLMDSGKNSVKNIFLLGTSMGLGMLVKPTFAIFSIIPLGTFLMLSHKNVLKLVRSSAIVAVILALILVPYFKQNINLFGNVTGRNIFEPNDPNFNAMVTIPSTVSNILRNLVINIPFPFFYESFSNYFDKAHSLLGLGVNDARTTFKETPFSLPRIIYPQEDVAANPIHLLLIAVALPVLVLRRSWKNKMVVSIYCLTVFSFILYSAFLRWQPFGVRFQMPFLVMGATTAGLVLFNYKFGGKLIYLLVAISIPLALLMVLLNVSKPYISYRFFLSKVGFPVPGGAHIPQAFYERPREMQYFNSRWYWYEPYNLVARNFVKGVYQYHIAFDFMEDFKYPFWVVLKERGISFKVVTPAEADRNTYLISTSPAPFEDQRYNTLCYVTPIEYGYACVSKMK